MTNEDPLMDDDQAGEAVAHYLEQNPELLQGIVPAHDLWPAIENRISARVIPISTMQTTPTHAARRSLGWIPMLIAASALIVASAGITYVLTTRTATQGAGQIAQPQPQRQPQPIAAAVAANDVTARGVTARGSQDSPAVVREQRPAVRLASRATEGGSDGMRRTYDSEITTLHAVLEARRGQLNQSTVAIIEQNLRVIDDAILQSKAALAKDPNSSLLNDQLDRTLAKKTGLLRAAALLPAA